jgi:hypothetical protein
VWSVIAGACIHFKRGLSMKRSSTRRSILIDEDYVETKRYRVGVLSETAIEHFEDLLAELDNVRPPRTLGDFQRWGIRLGVVSKALLAVAKEAR